MVDAGADRVKFVDGNGATISFVDAGITKVVEDLALRDFGLL